MFARRLRRWGERLVCRRSGGTDHHCNFDRHVNDRAAADDESGCRHNDETTDDHHHIDEQYHHEQYDGLGYPDGLKGEDIPLLARILCLADAYDSMIADRPYRPAQSRDYALEEIRRCSGTHTEVSWGRRCPSAANSSSPRSWSPSCRA